MELKIKWRVGIQIAIAVLVWGYIIYRAFFISITQDEAHTYLLVKTNNWRQALGTTNTHWLNSLFIKIFLWMPGKDPLWKIRMFSVLSWIIYSFSAIRLSSFFKTQWLGFIFFVIAILNPFLIFYFGLARGYAPACAFIMLSLLLAAKCIQAKEVTPQKWFYVFVSVSVATFANFTAFYFFMGLMGAFLLPLIANKKLTLIFHRSARSWVILISGTSVITVGALSLVKSLNNLWFPGKSNIVNSLFGSLIQNLSYFDNDSADYYDSYYKEGVAYLLNNEILRVYQAMGIIVFLLFMIAVLSSAYSFFLSKQLTLNFLALFCCFITILFNGVFHLFFKTPYLFNRTTLILYPPLAVGLFNFIDSGIQNSMLYRKIVHLLLFLLLIVFSYNFYKSLSLTNFSDWPIQTNTEECLNYMKSSNAKMVGISEWHYSVFTNYYLKAYPDKYDFNYQVISKSEQLDSLNTSLPLRFDYLLLAPPYRDSAVLKSWDVKLSFQKSGAKVLKRDTINFSN